MRELRWKWMVLFCTAYGGAAAGGSELELDIDTHLPAAARCCADAESALNTDSRECLNPNTGVATAMALTCNFSSFSIRKNGNIMKAWVTDDGRVLLKLMAWKFEMNTGSYCMGNTTTKLLRVAVCPPSIDHVTMSAICVVSVVFLLLTVLVYGALPELRDLQGLSVISLCCALAALQIVASAASMLTTVTLENCAAHAFSIYFFLFASLAWMNAITLQMFRSVRYSEERAGAGSGRLAFVWYSLYGWGLPAALLAVVLLANYIPPEERSIGIGISNCWFWEASSKWLYQYVPLILLSLSNCALFAWSSYILWRQPGGAQCARHKTNRYKFLFNLRLFVVMGISWVFDPISFAHGGNHIIWDIAQVWTFLQGVWIFVVLVLLRKRALKGLVRRNYTLCLTPALKRCLEFLSDEDDVDFMQHFDVVEASETVLNSNQ